MNNILLLGDIIIDKYYYGKVNRIAQEYPVPIINIDTIKEKLGCVGNVLENIKDFFDNIYIVTCIDQNTIVPLNKLLECKKIIHKNFEQNNKKLIIKNRIFSNNQMLSRFDEEIINNITEENEIKIIKYIESIIDNFKIVILSDYLKGFLTDSLCKKIIDLCNIKKKITIVDPKGNNYNKYKNCTLIKPNKKEANDFYGTEITNKNINDFSKKLIDEYHIQYIINTLGNQGMRLIYKDSKNKIKIKYKNIIPSQIIDVTGCGDTILSTISVYYSKNKNFDDKNNILEILTKIGNIAVNTHSCYKLNKKDWNKINEKINNKIVFTNGCFDLIHIGHIKFLKECKKLGSKLILGINTDESIKQIKGEKRPINKLIDRINFLKELNIIDEIIPFREKTPLNLIQKIKPDILVKGNDYKLENVIGKEYAKETILLPYLDGYSSTNIIKKINKK